MFVPSHYRQPDHYWMVELMRRNPLALLATNGGPGSGPFATHLPVITDPEMTGEWSQDLSGGALLGHLNRANPHWAALESGAPALLSFTGPHGYVSPTVYGLTPAAPTWNFTAVHVRGTLHKIDSIEQTLDVVKATVRALEGDFGDGWDMTESVDYFRRIVPAVGAFRLVVAGAVGMFKLSQEQRPDVRARVENSFGQRECTGYRETAELMGRLPAPGRR